jgi:shikimate kinase
MTSPHILLVGLPGSGKSSVGERVARRMGRPFVDFDVEIERREGVPVATIFRERGERAFRELELALTRELAGTRGMILAPGGGWITVPGALALLRPPARMIYLRVAPNVAIRRMGSGRSARPLLQSPDPAAELARLLSRREPLYLLADRVVDVDLLGLQGVTDVVYNLATTEWAN